MSLITSCCFFPKEDSIMLKEYIHDNAMSFLENENFLGLDALPRNFSDDTSIGAKRRILQDIYPFRVKHCRNRLLKCCGSCTSVCRERCVQDIYTKLTMYLSSVCVKPYKENIYKCNSLAQSIYKLIVNPNTTYDQLVDTCNQLISIRRNSSMGGQIKEMTPNTVERRALNPWRLNYASEPEMYYDKARNTHRPVADSRTGIIKFREWPLSGMCPFCLPKVTSIQKRDRRKTEDSL